MKKYLIFIAKDESFSDGNIGWHRAHIIVGKYTARIGRFTSPRAARKAAKDFIKQIKEAEAG